MITSLLDSIEGLSENLQLNGGGGAADEADRE